MSIMRASKKEKIIHSRILEFLKKNSKGLTMSELVKGTSFSRKAIEKHLQILILENEIYMKQFGVTKVYFPNHRIHHFDFERLNYNNKTFWFDVLESEFGIYLLIQKKKKVDKEWVHEHSITIPLEQSENFLKVLEKILNSQRIKKLFDKIKNKK
ncbi:hypothetical protein GF386_02005 [Candidatus Pacearchaeota archaeon]|nr:hypothetical protein [Candidatus Pacearchaeota archaeon]MBD3282947.1 hypothetical protein [Candidatus Pacearchaeota archaeon]